MPIGDAYSSGHLVPSLSDLYMFYLLRQILFSELVVISPDYALRISLGTFSILLQYTLMYFTRIKILLWYEIKLASAGKPLFNDVCYIGRILLTKYKRLIAVPACIFTQIHLYCITIVVHNYQYFSQVLHETAFASHPNIECPLLLSLNIFYFLIRNGIWQKLHNIMIALSLSPLLVCNYCILILSWKILGPSFTSFDRLKI